MVADRFDVIVVGAGVFGVWTALVLQRSGRRTALMDAWGVAHPRASSAGETRIIRAGYGTQDHYSEWAWEALSRWKALEEETGAAILVPCGVLWLARAGDAALEASRQALERLGIPRQRLTPAGLRKKFPAFDPRGAEDVDLEPEACVLLARRACRLVARTFAAEGGDFRFGQVLPPEGGKGTLKSVRLAGGRQLSADAFVFCAGPWLGPLFPDVVGEKVKPTRQEVFFFGTPAGSEEYFPPRSPAWIDLSGEEEFYGIPAVDGRGFKVASDERGPEFDPTSGERTPSAAELKKVRGYLARRVPALSAAPLVEARVCQYEQTPDSELILDRHPEWSNVVLAGGGSGHGFKLGPVVGELAAGLVLDADTAPPPQVRLDRFS